MAFCVDIAGGFVSFALSRPGGHVTEVEAVPTPTTQSWPDLVAALGALIRRHSSGADDLATLALSVAARVDPDNGLVVAAPGLPALVGHCLAFELTAALGRRVKVAKDTDCFALAEATVGAGRGKRVVFGILLDASLGGGLVVDGRLVPGAGGFVGDWGHGPIVKPVVGAPEAVLPRFACCCGQSGCLETIGSARGLERLHEHLTGSLTDSSAILDAWRIGDAAAGRTISIWRELMAEPLALLANTIGPHIMPVGGALGAATDLVATLDAAVRQRILRPSAAPLLVPATLGDPARLIGAAVLAQQDGG